MTGPNAPRRGDVGVGHDAHDEEARRARHGERAVEVPGVLRCRSGEVDVDDVAGHRDGDADLEVAVDRLDHVRGLVPAVGHGGDARAHRPLGVAVQLVHRPLDTFSAPPRHELRDPPLGEALRRQLRAKVATALVRVPGVRRYQRHQALVERRRREDQAFLVEVGRERRQAGRLDPADVRVVRAADGVPGSSVRDTRVMSGRCVRRRTGRSAPRPRRAPGRAPRPQPRPRASRRGARGCARPGRSCGPTRRTARSSSRAAP